MVKNSAAQYEVVVVDDEDELNGSGGIGGSIQRHQRLRKNGDEAKMVFDTSGGGGDGGEGGEQHWRWRQWRRWGR